MTLKTDGGGWRLIDADYFDNALLAIDPHEDRLPSLLAKHIGRQTVVVPLGIQHGNLLSNGQGLFITTKKLIDDNKARGYDADDVEQVLRQFYGATEVVFLENLDGEPTGHIDMFATFTSPNTIVVADESPTGDAVNAAVLDHNAERLAAVAAPHGPLRVVRIPMPRRRRSAGGPLLWQTYTNVVYANNTLLVPVCHDSDVQEVDVALEIYKRLLPNWTIVPIDATPLVQQFGSLHCATMNLGSERPLTHTSASAN